MNSTSEPPAESGSANVAVRGSVAHCATYQPTEFRNKRPIFMRLIYGQNNFISIIIWRINYRISLRIGYVFYYGSFDVIFSVMAMWTVQIESGTESSFLMAL